MSDYDNVLEVDFIDDDDDDDELEYFLEDMEEDDDDEFMSDDDDDSLDDLERRRRRKRRAKRRASARASGRGYYKRMLKGYATRKQLRAALARVGRDVRRNRSGVTNNGRRITSLSRSTGKAIKTVRSDLDNIKQMSLFTSLLGGDKSLKVVSDDSNTIPKGAVIEFKDESDIMDKLLPVIMMGGMGGGSGKGGMMDNPLMMVLLLGGLK